jgi:hypothetical protein
VTEFAPEGILRILDKHEVRRVLIGGLAAASPTGMPERGI